MKKRIISLIASTLIVALALFSVAGIATVVTGCQASQSAVTYKSAGTQSQEIAVQRIKWADYVVAERKRIKSIADESLKSSQSADLESRHDSVSAALESYQAAHRAAKARLQSLPAGASAPVPADVVSAGAAYLTAVKTNLR